MSKYISDIELSNFLAEAPLYSKVEFFNDRSRELNFNIFTFFSEKPIKTFCPVDKDFQTFKIPKQYGKDLTMANKAYDDGNFQKDGTYSCSFQLTARCQFCNNQINYLLNIFTTEPRSSDHIWPIVYLRKAGQLPALNRRPDKEIYNYLTEADKDFYGKALASLSHGYGIGAYAYLRRIVENEIRRLVVDISELDYENAAKVKEAFKNFEANHQMNTLIDTIYPLLPSSLREMGQNPLKALYQQTSEGIHEMTEDQCIEKAQYIDKLMQFVIRRVSSLKNEYQQVREALRQLSK